MLPSLSPQLCVSTMGGDGGSIPTRDDLVTTKRAKVITDSKIRDRQLYSYCALSKVILCLVSLKVTALIVRYYRNHFSSQSSLAGSVNCTTRKLLSPISSRPLLQTTAPTVTTSHPISAPFVTSQRFISLRIQP